MAAKTTSKNPPGKPASANGGPPPTKKPRINFGQLKDRLGAFIGVHAQSQIRAQVRVQDFLMGETYITLGVTDIRVTMSDKGKPDLVEFFIG